MLTKAVNSETVDKHMFFLGVNWGAVELTPPRCSTASAGGVEAACRPRKGTPITTCALRLF
eukprot:11725539-Alexandrium_andersonii.AAC.1